MKLSIANLIVALLCTGILGSAQQERPAAGELVDYYSAEFKVPVELVEAVIQVESGWQPYVVSNRGAVGLMQLMPATAATFGVTNRFEIYQNLRAGVAYLARLLTLFHGDVRLVAAAYLAGEKHVTSAGLRYSNAEVFAYVQKVLNVYRQKCMLRKEIEGGNRP
jgi:soluble lytic murein transglycosylase-like protein